MNSRTVLIGILLLATVGAAAVLYQRQTANQTTVQPATLPVISVSTEPVRVAPMVETAASYGNLVARRSVDIVPQSPGQVKQIYFTDGGAVAAGAPLVLIDPSVAQAQLQSARAQAETDDQNLRRTQLLSRQGLQSTSSLEEAEARKSASEADVKINELKLEQLTLRAPFAGTLGSSDIDVGAFVSTGDVIVRLQDTSELQIEFRMPSNVAPRVSQGMTAHVQLPKIGGSEEVDGQLSFVDPTISTDTRSILLRAIVPNVGRRVRPGLFVRVDLDLSTHPDALVVPDVAVTQDLNGSYVFVVDDKDVAHRRMVTIGLTNGTRVELLDGVKAGEQVVTIGQFRLNDGDLVKRVPAPPVPAPAMKSAT